MSAGRSTELHVTILSPATAKLVYDDDFMVDGPILDPHLPNSISLVVLLKEEPIRLQNSMWCGKERRE